MPEWIREWWGVLAGGGLAMMAVIKFLFANEAKHKDSKVRIDAIEEQLEEGGVLFAENRKDHKEIQTCLRAVGESQARTETHIEWLVEERKQNGDTAGG